MPRTSLAVLIATLFLIASCESKARSTTSPGFTGHLAAPATQIFRGLPELPHEHSVSTSRLNRLEGTETYDRSYNALDIDTSLSLNSGVGELSWGIWQFNLTNLSAMESLQVVMTVTEGNEAWIALSDYARNTWEISGPHTSSESFTIDNEKHRASGGSMYIAVITASSQALVHYMELTSDDGWVIVSIPGSNCPGNYSSMEVVGEKPLRPAISYYGVGGYLACALSSTATGTNESDWHVEIVDISGTLGAFNSIANVGGKPAISYHDYTNQSLMYARRGTLGWTKVVVDDGDGEEVGTHTSLAVVNGKPCIAYRNDSQDSLCLARSTTPDGTSESDWVLSVLDDSDYCGDCSSLAEVDEIPAVSYLGDSWGEVRYKWTGHPTATRIAYTTNPNPARTSLTLVNSKPAIGWLDSVVGSKGNLCYSYSSTTSGSDAADWATIIIEDAEAYIDLNVSLSAVDGRPAISYCRMHGASDRHLIYAWSTTPEGDDPADWEKVTVDTDSQLEGKYISLVEVNGKPAISYYDDSTGLMKYAIRMGP